MHLFLTTMLVAVFVTGSAFAESINVSPTSIRLLNGRQQSQLVVTAGTATNARDITRIAKFQSANPKIVAVDKLGVVKPVGNGKTSISISAGQLATRIPVTVSGMDVVKPISFRHQALPILAKTGCSAGSCHGSPHGKAGFRLSLFGTDPLHDAMALVRDARSRRVSPLDPDNSMLLLKPTMQVAHLGGKRFDQGSVEYNLLRSWISEGCDITEPSVACTGIEVYPSTQRVIRLPTAKQQFRVIAKFADGSTQDVTHLAKFETSDISIAEVSRNGYVEGYTRGDIAVIVRYLDFIETPLLTFVKDVPDFAWKLVEQKNYIDEQVDHKLLQMQYLPSGICSDETFIRRVYLDTTGLLPSPEQRQQFLESVSKTKRADLIDDLLAGAAHASFWAQKWGDLLRVSRKQLGLTNVYKYAQWLKSAFAQNMPYDQFAKEILLAGGNTAANPAANYYRTAADTNDAMETSAQLFLGTRIQCAKCHNHPFERWTQNNYFGLAAVFNRVGRQKLSNDEMLIFTSQSGEVYHPASGEPMSPWVPGHGELAVNDSQDRREAFITWLTAPENGFFARVESNRLWAQVMGRGIVEPFDDFRDSNPPSNPRLLEALANDFQNHNYDRRHLLKTILNSRTYQTSSRPNSFNRSDSRYFSHYLPRRLTAEQLVDALTDVTGVPVSFVGVPAGTRATELPAPDLKPHRREELGNIDFLKVFGQPERQSVCECERGDATSLGQALQLLNGEYLNKLLTSDKSRFHQAMKNKAPLDEIIRDIYVRALSRMPTASEMTAAQNYAGKVENPQIAIEDIAWAILNKSEFLFQH